MLLNTQLQFFSNDSYNKCNILISCESIVHLYYTIKWNIKFSLDDVNYLYNTTFSNINTNKITTLNEFYDTHFNES